MVLTNSILAEKETRHRDGLRKQVLNDMNPLTAILEGVELVSMTSPRRSSEDDTSGSLPLLSDNFSYEESVN